MHAALCGCWCLKPLVTASNTAAARWCPELWPCTSLCTSHPQGIQSHWQAGSTAAAAANNLIHRPWPLQAVVMPEQQTLLIHVQYALPDRHYCSCSHKSLWHSLGLLSTVPNLFLGQPESHAWLQPQLRSSGVGHGASRLLWCMGGRLTGSGCEPSLQTLRSRCWSAQAGAM